MADLVRVYQFRDRDHICCHDVSVTQCYALEMLVAERLTEARRAAQQVHRAALARPQRRPLRARLGEALIALGEWLRRGVVLAPQPS